MFESYRHMHCLDVPVALGLSHGEVLWVYVLSALHAAGREEDHRHPPGGLPADTHPEDL